MALWRTPLAACLALALAATASAQVKSPAELLPADTLAYAELLNPGQAAQDLGALAKGSLLDDFDAWLGKLRNSRELDGSLSDGTLETIALMFGPEMRSEAKRFQGAAVALTGVDRNHRPQFVAILLTGDSQVPVLALKSFLSGTAAGKKVATVEGVPLYRQTQSVNPGVLPTPFGQLGFAGGGLGFRGIGAGFGGVGNLGWGDSAFPGNLASADGFGPVYAYTAGLLVAGSGQDVVGDVIRRQKGRLKNRDLTFAPAYRSSAALRERPGLYLCADLARLADRLDKARRARGEGEPLVDALLRELVNPKAVAGLSVNLGLQEGVLDLQLAARLDPKERSPLLDLVAAGKLDLLALKGVPKEGVGSFTVRLPREGRWEKLLACVDALARASGELGMSPSEAVPALEDRLKKSLAREVGDRLVALTVLPPGVAPVGPGVPHLPGFLLHAESPAGAEGLAALVPALCAFVSGEKTQPAKETVDRQVLWTVAGTGLPWRSPLYYGVSGSLLAIGQDRAQVLAALQARASGGLAADEKLAARLAGPREVSAIGTWQWGASLEAAFLAQAKAIAGAEVSVVEPIGPGGLPAVPAAPEMPADPLKDPVGWLRKIAGLAEPEPEDPEASVRRAQAAEARAWRELGASLKGVPPVVVVVSRTPEEFRLELRQPGLPAIAPRLIDRGGEWYRRWQHQVFPPVIEDALINAPIGIGR